MRSGPVRLGKTARPFALVLVGAVVVLSVAMMAGQAFGQTGGVCDRTSEVSAALVAASGAGSCSLVTPLLLRDVTFLDLSDQSISSLSASDFDGLFRLRELDLSDNVLTSLPDGIFDKLFLLRALRLNDNALTTLPKHIFAQLFLLEVLDLSGNASLSLPAGMFEDFSLFDGLQSNGEYAADTGDYPRISRYLTKHSVTSPEGFIDALPPLYKERFTIVYKSRAAAKDHVSGEHPRIISFGGDGRYTFAWNTDPNAPSKFRDSVEFLRQNDDDWTAGIIDFSGATPSISEPSSCQTCHGSLNKPLWDGWNEWKGTELADPATGDPDKPDPAIGQPWYETAPGYTEALLESTDERVEPLNFDTSHFLPKNGADESPEYGKRFLGSPGHEGDILAVEEAGGVWAWAHAQVLFQRMRSRPDFQQYIEELTCTGRHDARFYAINRVFGPREHNLAVPANIPDDRIGSTGRVLGHSDFVSFAYFYTFIYSSIADAMAFLALVELWEQEPVVRKVHRDTSNRDALTPESSWLTDGFLAYKAGKATAEDELIQRLRLHFGQGSRDSVDARAKQNRAALFPSSHSSAFWSGHVEAMRERVCQAIRKSDPKDLQVTLDQGSPVLDWDAPTFDDGSVTGYRILRGPTDGTPSVLVSTTGKRDTTWTDESAGAGDYVYAVQTVYDNHYVSRESDRVHITVVAPPPKPIRLRVSATSDSVTLTWRQPRGGGVTGYQILRRDVKKTRPGTPFDVLVEDTGSAEPSYTDVDVVAGGAYAYRIRALNAGGRSRTTTYVTVSVPERQPNSPATGSPTITGNARVGDTLAANTSAIVDADGLSNVSYSYQWVRTDGSNDLDIGGATASSYTLVSDDQGKTIKLRVSFSDDAGNSESLTSAPTASVAAAVVKPARPTGLTAAVTHESVTLTWDDPQDPTITGYQVLRRDKSVHAKKEFAVHVEDTGSAALSYTDTDVVEQGRYTYRIKARNSAGLSPRSSFTSLEIPERPP